ncbi:PIN domain-containing protein [Microbulbifer rhizosphaerae]|uniref:Putative nucleic acid-binding protein n=1 Tax=Microbulbifer rhizosphaerae TaxID=1562603 RepID=A0A7W4WG60_9GAMM|nr:PIN domain-containing protein [Microbulbifer rhizosphaerae]MBB3063617.1 putative nucleic acid-binding protein [Microbulbifer rhizosphaerae]
MKQVILDNHILIWGIKEQAEAGQEEMIERTQQFFEECKRKKTKLLIPSVVVGELLTAVEAKYHPMTLNLLQGSFLIPPYDAASSAIFARLWREKKESGAVNQIREELQATRQELKADCMIVATAIAQKVDAIFSHDAKLKAFANGQIQVLEVPRLQAQQRLSLEET